ncbi:hypothetical protein ACP70R_000133 [Stipagrostis hirtigluma subsp. patula]
MMAVSHTKRPIHLLPSPTPQICPCRGRRKPKQRWRPRTAARRRCPPRGPAPRPRQ